MFPTAPVMPVMGSGIVPGGALGAQLQALTRRAVIPSIFVQIYQSHPLLSIIMANAQTARGGISQVTFPIQGASFSSFAWGSFAGDFDIPSDQAAVRNAQFDLKLGMVPVGFFGMESLIQSSEVIIPKLRVVMSDAAVVMKQAYAQALYGNSAQTGNSQAWDSLYSAYDDGTNTSSYGGVERGAGTPYWSGSYINAGSMASPLTRVGISKILLSIQNAAGGEAPDFAVMNPIQWGTLMGDFMSLEQFTTRPRSIYAKDDVVNAGFRAIRVMDTPIFLDPNCPVGEMYAINTRYLAMYLSEYAPMTFSGFESMISVGQMAEIGVLISAANICCAKPASGGHVYGLPGTTLIS